MLTITSQCSETSLAILVAWIATIANTLKWKVTVQNVTKNLAWPAKIKRNLLVSMLDRSYNDIMAFETESRVSFSIYFKLLFHHCLPTFSVNFLLMKHFRNQQYILSLDLDLDYPYPHSHHNFVWFIYRICHNLSHKFLQVHSLHILLLQRSFFKSAIWKQPASCQFCHWANSMHGNLLWKVQYTGYTWFSGGVI